jgi:adenylylsulfate kinase
MQIFSVTKETRERKKNQIGTVVWFTGLSGAGKTTIANELEKLLLNNDNHTYILDGDICRKGLSADLHFDKKSREENLRRIRYVAAMFCDAGLITLVTFISPFQEDRAKARMLLEKHYVEIYVKVTLEVAEKRDPKGLYIRARKGEIPDFTGIHSPYEEPETPHLILDTEKSSATECALKVFRYLKDQKFIY